MADAKSELTILVDEALEALRKNPHLAREWLESGILWGLLGHMLRQRPDIQIRMQNGVVRVGDDAVIGTPEIWMDAETLRMMLGFIGKANG